MDLHKRAKCGIICISEVEKGYHNGKEVYGCRKIQKALESEGKHVSEWKIRRIMKENGIYLQTRKSVQQQSIQKNANRKRH